MALPSMARSAAERLIDANEKLILAAVMTVVARNATFRFGRATATQERASITGVAPAVCRRSAQVKQTLTASWQCAAVLAFEARLLRLVSSIG